MTDDKPLKILSMMAECSNDVSWNNTHYFEQAVGKIAECKWAGHSHKDHKPGEDLNDTIKRVMPDADWVIVYERAHTRFKGAIEIPEKRACKIAFVVSDVYVNPPVVAKRINKGHWDAILMQQTKLPVGLFGRRGSSRWQKIDPDYYLESLNAPVFSLTPSINPEIFAPSNRPKTIDVSFLGAHHPTYYPIRSDIWQRLPSLSRQYRWRALIRGTPPGKSLKSRNIDELLKKRYFVGKKYAMALSLSKIFIFDGGIDKCPVKKYFEGMASGTCVLADTPITAKELHFYPDWNFVEIDRNNWVQKLRYYLAHNEQREQIAKRGYETIMKYHTNDIRARQLVDFLETHS